MSAAQSACPSERWIWSRRKQLAMGELATRIDPQATHQPASGSITVQAMMDKEGRVTDLKPLNGSFSFLPGVARAVREWRYEPTYLDGKPMETRAEIEIDFHARQCREPSLKRSPALGVQLSRRMRLPACSSQDQASRERIMDSSFARQDPHAQAVRKKIVDPHVWHVYQQPSADEIACSLARNSRIRLAHRPRKCPAGACPESHANANSRESRSTATPSRQRTGGKETKSVTRSAAATRGAACAGSNRQRHSKFPFPPTKTKRTPRVESPRL